MRIRHGPATLNKIELQMTPMIDIVFQLNIFFLITFKIILPEGDFNIRMPADAAARSLQTSEALPITVVLKADADGQLADLRLNGRSFGKDLSAFAQLHREIRGMVHDAGGPGTAADLEVEITADYDLHYYYTYTAIDALTGYVENGQSHKLIERIKFTPPKSSGGQGARSNI